MAETDSVKVKVRQVLQDTFKSEVHLSSALTRLEVTRCLSYY